MNDDQDNRMTRFRYTAAGALAALAVAGAIAGTAALAAKPPAKSPAAPPPVSLQPFLGAIQQLVDNGTITAAEGQTVDGEIQAGRVDTDTLASSGFTPAQLQAVGEALGDAKRALAAAAPPAAPGSTK